MHEIVVSSPFVTTNTDPGPQASTAPKNASSDPDGPVHGASMTVTARPAMRCRSSGLMAGRIHDWTPWP